MLARCCATCYTASLALVGAVDVEWLQLSDLLSPLYCLNVNKHNEHLNHFEICYILCGYEEFIFCYKTQF